jgi:hypothetical protein
MRAAYHKIAAKISKEHGEDEGEDLSNEMSSVVPEKTVSLDQSRLKKAGRGGANANIKIVVDEAGDHNLEGDNNNSVEDFEIIAEGKYDRKNLIY